MPADLYKTLAGEVRGGLCFHDSFNGTANSAGNSIVSIVGNPIIRNGVYDSTAGAGRSIIYSAIPTQRQWVTSGFTVAFWLNVAQSTFDGTFATIFDNCSLSPNTGGLYIVIDDRGGGSPTNGLNVAFGSGTGGATNRTGVVSNCISNNTWEHFVIVCSTTAISIYKNGTALSVTNTGSGTGYLPTFANMRFGGRSSDGGFPLQAMVKATRFYTGQLSAQEAADLYSNATSNWFAAGKVESAYNFSEAGPLRDLSGLGKDASLAGGTTDPTRLQKSGYLFDGSDDYIVVPPTMPHFVTSYTLAALCKPGVESGTGGVIYGVGNNYEHYLYGGNYYGRNRTGSFVSTSAAPYKVGVVQSFISTYDGTTIKAYINGVLVGSASQTGTTVDSVYLPRIGKGATVVPFSGVIYNHVHLNYAVTPLQASLIDQELRAWANHT